MNLYRLLIVLITPLSAICQPNLSYKELTPALDLLKNHICCNTCSFYNNEEPLRQKILSLNWDLDNIQTFENLYDQVKSENLDYRYYLVIAKAASSYYRSYRRRNDTYTNIIDYYYRSLFLNLAIENGPSGNIYKDSLKYQFTQQYILSTIEDSCFPSYTEFKVFADLNIKYSKGLLNSMRLNLGKSERSELYFIIGDAIYRTNYSEEKDEQSLSEVLKYLSLAIKEDSDNWRALSIRADLKKDTLRDYKSAIKDYLLLLNIFETDNKIRISEHNKWLARRKLTAANNKSITGIRPVFEEMLYVTECYLALNDYKNCLLWLEKAQAAIKQYKEYSRYSEYASNYEGLIHYFKALSYHELKQKQRACSEIELAVNSGHDINECKELSKEINCDNDFQANSNVTSIPMKKINGVYEIPISINGVLKLNFIFDAGATDVSISPDVALTLIRTGTVSDSDFRGSQTYKFADGSVAKSKVFIIKEIQIGDKKVRNVKASISNSLDAPLLLGQSVLNRFGKVTIDYNRELILFEN
ncbi:MAG: retroviral-like aspartic protease family protein [Verrucomicrobia bacterium]|nr:retroviral-like aspartic protease family protein [Verrucomicrobiota bacterium]